MNEPSKTHKLYKNVRLTVATYERLVAAIQNIEAAVEAGRIADPGIRAEAINPATRGLTFDAMISLLLDRRDAHAERGRKSRAKK
jgi:hypothetical protein